MDAFHTIPTTPYQDQEPGTSGLRKRVTDFKQPHYLENFVQSIFDTVRDFRGGKILLGGDGRYYNDEAVQIILRMSAANGVSEVILGENAILSTPAASHLIRKYHLNGGLVLSASHNPAGQNGDFGIKLNLKTGGPAPTSVTDAIFARSQTLTHYRIADGNIDTSRIGTQNLGDMRVTVVDPVEDFAEFMEELFDFSAIKALIESGFFIAFDAMSAVTGPYATEIFGNRLGVSHDQLYNTRPLPDFGGAHPDPNPVHANALFGRMFGPNPPDFGAASDGDGDRYIALGRHFYVSPSDCLAVIAANAHLAPGYKDGIKGIARSMPTGRAADNVAAHLDIPIYETPTGWKYFGNLMDAGRITICGEESASTSSDHIREKDGLWGVLMWLNIIAAKGESVEAIVRAHWRKFGRHYYTRHDYEEVDKASAESVIATLYGQLETLTGQSLQGETIETADSFTYTDPVDGTVTKNQGLRVFFESGSRLVMRLSGTGTKGATLRIYLERYVGPEGDHDIDLAEATAGLAMIADTLTDLKQTLNRDAPSVIS